MTAVVARRAGAGWLMLATTTAGLVNYGYALVLTHGLTPAQYAAFAAGQALLVVRAAIGAAGIPWLLARELARAGADEHRRVLVTTFAFWANIALGALLTTLATGAVLIFGSAGDAAAVALASLIMSVGSTGLGYLQGTGRMTAIALLFTLECLVKAAVGAILVFGAGAGSAGALAGFVAGSLVLLAPLPGFRHLLRRPAWQPALLRAVLHQTRLQAGVALISAADTVLVAALGLGAAGGPYQAASALGRVPLFASNAIATAAFPRLHGPGAGERKAAALRSYLIIGVLLAGALITLPAPLRSLLFPEAFAAVGSWLPWAAVLGLAVGLINLCVTFLQADDPARTGRSVTLITGGYLTVVLTAGATFGVRGIAVGAALAAACAVAALALLPPVRSGWRSLRPGPVAVAVPAVLLLALTLTTDVYAWLALAALAAVLAGCKAFPEPAVFRRPR